MSSKLRFVLCGMALLLAASCVESERPLSDASKSAQDTRLHGVWVRTNDRGERDYLHIGAEKSTILDSARPEPEPGLMRYCTISHARQSGGLSEAMQGDFFRTRIADVDYANWVIPVDEAKHKPITYLFMKYAVDDKQLQIWEQDAEVTARAIESGKLKGIVKRGAKKGGPVPGDFEELRITDTSDNIAVFLAGEKDCFPEKSKVVYTRVQ